MMDEFMKLYEIGPELKKDIKTGKVNKSCVPELGQKKKSKREHNTLQPINNNEDPTQGSSKKERSSRKKKNYKVDLEVKRMNLVMNIMSDGADTQLDVSNIRASDRKPKKRNKSVTNTPKNAEEVASKKVKPNDSSSSKQKKRNKSAISMQEKAEELVSKKVKSIDSNTDNRNHTTDEEKMSSSAKRRKRRLNKLQSMENQNSNEDNIKEENKRQHKKEKGKKEKEGEESTMDTVVADKSATHYVSKKMNKLKKLKLQNEGIETATAENGDQSSEKENVAKKSKKKKRKAKSLHDANTAVKMDGEPPVKTRKQEAKAEAIAKDLEELNIGDNPHTLSNLLDEMTVVDKNKNKKDKQKRNKNKRKKKDNLEAEKAAEPGSTAEEKEKVKWLKRRWNKNRKRISKLPLQNSVIVENLPIKIMFQRKTLLSEHFGKFGAVAGVGVAEVYPTEEPKPVFTTTVYFKEEEGAVKALEDDNTLLEGNRIRVRRPLPPWETTVMLRVRAPLCDQTVSTALCGAGRIRSIRHLVKGTLNKAFVEFDGPKAVKRALEMAEEVKISGQKIKVYRFTDRTKKESHNSVNENSVDIGSDDDISD